MPALPSSIEAIRIAATAADRLKATDIVAFDVSEPIAITDAMLIASASNERQVLAVAEEVEKDLYLYDHARSPRSREGLEEAQWILLDYGDFVIHVMHDEARAYYGLERLWRDCPPIDLPVSGGAGVGEAGKDAAASSASPVPADGKAVSSADAATDIGVDGGVVDGAVDIAVDIAVDAAMNGGSASDDAPRA